MSKASEWAAKKREIEKAGSEFMVGTDMKAWVDHDGCLALRSSGIPISQIPRFVAWVNEWFGEPTVNTNNIQC